MDALGLYIMYLLILILVCIIFFFIKFIINFLKVNGVRTIFSSLFKKENRLGTITIFSFILIFWLSFFLIFYINKKNIVTLTFFESVITEDDDEVGYNDIVYLSKTKKINITPSGSPTYLTVLSYNSKYITYKLDKTMDIEICDYHDNCKNDIIFANKKYKLSSDNAVRFFSSDRKIECFIMIGGG